MHKQASDLMLADKTVTGARRRARTNPDCSVATNQVNNMCKYLVTCAKKIVTNVKPEGTISYLDNFHISY